MSASASESKAELTCQGPLRELHVMALGLCRCLMAAQSATFKRHATATSSAELRRTSAGKLSCEPRCSTARDRRHWPCRAVTALLDATAPKRCWTAGEYVKIRADYLFMTYSYCLPATSGSMFVQPESPLPALLASRLQITATCAA